jgi:hypothetical protein
MREIHGHEINECNEQLRITADDKNPHNGNASHTYSIAVLPSGRMWLVSFQEGPIKEAGVNGVTQEALLAILIDRLECFQESKWACDENAIALSNLRAARDVLLERTKKRLARGVEGTHTV